MNEEEKIEAIKTVIRQWKSAAQWSSEHAATSERRNYFKGKNKAYDNFLTLLEMHIDTIKTLIV